MLFNAILSLIMTIITPPALNEGDKIAIVSPSGAVNAEYIHKAVPVLSEQGWEPVVGEHAYDHHESYAGTAEVRYDDLRNALLDPDIKAVMCSRGGYGAVHILQQLDSLPLRDNPKWLIGFSDITILHALLAKNGIESIHGSMTSHLAKTGGEDEDSQALFDILRGTSITYEFPADTCNRSGEATGRLYGGNLAVFDGLIGTPYDFFNQEGDIILFMEDVAEPVYKVERQMYQLKLMGVFDRIKGLVVGQFTEYPGAKAREMEDMIARMVAGYDFPVAFDAPIGHVSHNIPLVEGRQSTLTVTPDGVTLRQ